MSKSLLTLLTVSLLCGTFLGLASVQAADVNVTWKSPEKYRDIYPGTQGKKRFRESTFKTLENHLLKLAKALPESQTLTIEVTDVDLAGDVHSSGLRQIRVIKDLYFPRIKFSFQLTNAEKETIQSGHVNLKDMNFMIRSRLRYKNKTLGYEKQLLDGWFKDAFTDDINK